MKTIIQRKNLQRFGQHLSGECEDGFRESKKVEKR